MKVNNYQFKYFIKLIVIHHHIIQLVNLIKEKVFKIINENLFLIMISLINK